LSPFSSGLAVLAEAQPGQRDAVGDEICLGAHATHGAASLAPRVTIIIPAYNAEHTLDKAVASALGQTETSLEVFIVDDASMDATWAVARRLAATDPRVRVVRLPENRGKSHVMNFATELARGTWIALLDADDWYAPTRIARLVDAAEACGVEMAADNLYFVDNHARRCTGVGFPTQGLERIVDLDAFLQMSDPTARYDYGMLQPVFRADFIHRHHLDYDERARIGEDFYQLLCFFQARGRGIVVDTPLYYYVEPFGSVSRRWAQPTRSRYRYESMLETHRHFAAVLGPQLDRWQRGLLDRRGAGIEAMVMLHQLHECLVRREPLGLVRRLAQATPGFWTVLCKKLASRTRAAIFPNRGSPIPDNGLGDAGAATGQVGRTVPAAPPVRWPRGRAGTGAVVRTLAGHRASRG